MLKCWLSFTKLNDFSESKVPSMHWYIHPTGRSSELSPATEIWRWMIADLEKQFYGEKPWFVARPYFKNRTGKQEWEEEKKGREGKERRKYNGGQWLVKERVWSEKEECQEDIIGERMVHEKEYLPKMGHGPWNIKHRTGNQQAGKMIFGIPGNNEFRVPFPSPLH